MPAPLTPRRDKRPLRLQLFEHEHQITFRQFVLNHLMAGQKHRDIARALGISTPTYYRWLASEGVQRELTFADPGG